MEEASFHAPNNVAVLKLCISNLENEIGVIFNQIQHLKQKCIHKNLLLENSSYKTQLSTTKLRSYQSKSQHIFHKTKAHQGLENMKDDIAHKKQALRDLQEILEINATSLSNYTSHSLGTTETEIQSYKIQQLLEIKIDLLTSIKELEVQVNSLKEEELQIEQTIKIIHKRNAAQLLRLKRLINEARLREQHWPAEVQRCLHKRPHADSK